MASGLIRNPPRNTIGWRVLAEGTLGIEAVAERSAGFPANPRGGCAGHPRQSCGDLEGEEDRRGSPAMAHSGAPLRWPP
jgi:hypothetical protein